MQLVTDVGNGPVTSLCFKSGDFLQYFGFALLATFVSYCTLRVFLYCLCVCVCVCLSKSTFLFEKHLRLLPRKAPS